MTILARQMKAFCVLRMEESMFRDVDVFSKLWTQDSTKVCDLANSRIGKAEAYAKDPATSQWGIWGFAPITSVLPFYEQMIDEEWSNDERVQGAFETYDDFDRHNVFIRLDNDQLFAIVEKRERILPGDTLRAEIDKECAALEQRQGEPVNRKQRMEIKDVVVARELATAKIRTRRIPILIQQSAIEDEMFDFVVFNSSRKIVEDVGHLLRSVFGSWPVYPMENDLTLPLAHIMTRLLKSPKDSHTGWQPFVHDHAAKLVSAIAKGGEVTLKDEDLVIDWEPSDRVRDLLDSSYLVNRMRYRFLARSPIEERGHVSFQLTAKGAFSGFKMAEGMLNDEDDGDALLDFNAFLFLLSDQVERILLHLHQLSEHFEPDREVGRKDNPPTNTMPDEENDPDDFDPLYEQALRFVRESNKASISGIQRHFRIGYNRSARIIEQMEYAEVISAPGENGVRTVTGPEINEDDLL